MTKNMVTLARSDPRVMTPVVELDRDRMLLGVGNGAVDLRTGARLAPNPAHRITVATPVDYAEDARAPLFEATVRDVFHGDAEMVAFFQRLVGYSILGDPKEDILVIPYGSGSNGKSTVVGAIRDALGEHAKIASADTFLSSGGGMGGSAGAAREDVLRRTRRPVRLCERARRGERAARGHGQEHDRRRSDTSARAVLERRRSK